jgi:hypothetical protein
MKTSIFWLTSMSLLSLMGQANAQDDRRLRSDATYSTHTYKHPNKAATARKWEEKSGVAVQQPAPGNTELANYKRQVPNKQPTGGITVEHTPSTDVANRNYKIQRVSQPTRDGELTPGTRIAKKQRKGKDDSTTGQE